MSNQSHCNFWIQHPALLIGLTFLSAMSWVSIFWILYLCWLKKWRHLLLIPFSALYVWGCSSPHNLAKETRQGRFSIHSLQPHQSPFYRGLVYKGTLYLPEGAIPCSIYCQREPHPIANVDYLLTGKLTPLSPNSATFNPKQWIPIAKTWSLAELRYQIKKKLKSFLNRKLPSPRVAILLGSLLTGDVEDRSLRYEFGRLGLQHILAISGFHFGILIAFCSFFLNLFLPQKTKLLFLLFSITIYFFFIGPAPAVQRSWIAALLYLTGSLIQRTTTGLNLLGIGLMIEILLDPLVSSQIGFQLSFTSCGGILLLHPLIEKRLRSLLPKRNTFAILHLNLLSKHAHLASTTLRHAISLGASVNLALFPILLYHFHQFPLLSLLYNLFFPFLIALALFLLLLSFACPPLFLLTDWFTAQLLNLVAYPPLALDYVIGAKNIPHWTIPIYLFGLFSLSLHLKEKEWETTTC